MILVNYYEVLMMLIMGFSKDRRIMLTNKGKNSGHINVKKGSKVIEV